MILQESMSVVAAQSISNMKWMAEQRRPKLYKLTTEQQEDIMGNL